MTNTCDIVITTGNNIGKLCRDINKYCRHKHMHCKLCDELFSHKSSYERHLRLTHKVAKKTPKIVKKSRINDLEKELKLLRQHYIGVSERVDKVEREPRNIIVIGDEKIFISLVKKMGEHHAMEFLLDNIEHKDSINIVEKMYLEGVDKNRYPIACTDNYKFRYLNHSGDIVDDRGGGKIVSKLKNEIHSALIEANSQLIHSCVDTGDNIKLYNVYDIRNIQTQLGHYRDNDTGSFRDDLAKKVYNKTHPFFT